MTETFGREWYEELTPDRSHLPCFSLDLHGDAELGASARELAIDSDSEV